MSNCEKIEKSLWDYATGNITGPESEEIKTHLKECCDCSLALKTIEAILESKESDQSVIAGMDSSAFDDAVMGRIKNPGRSNLLKDKIETNYIIRMSVSMTIAAAVVLFMLLSISDLDQINTIPKKSSGLARKAKIEYRVMNITLSPQDDGASNAKREDVAEAEAPIDSKAKIGKFAEVEKPAERKDVITILPPPLLESSPESVAVEEIYLADKYGPEKLDEPIINRAIENSYATTDKSNMKKDRFSIINAPLTQASPESVNIEAVYLTDEAVPIISQRTQASLHEVLVDSGMIQAVETPSSVLITVDKMPVPINIIIPEYPVWAKKRGLSGAVWVKAMIDTDGNVVNAFVLSSNNPGLGFEEASLEAAQNSKYQPAEANSIKIPVWIILPVKFIYKSE